MKKLPAFFLLLAISIQSGAQKKLFVRIYDNEGRKIKKGFVAGATDTSLQLIKKKDTIDLPLTGFSFLKTKRSAGNNVLVGSMIGAATFGILGVVSADPDEFLGYTAAEGLAGGLVFGAPAGAAIGAITALFKRPKTFTINGNADKWKEFQTLFEKISAKSKAQ